LDEWASRTRALLNDSSLTDGERCDRFVAAARADLRQRMPARDAEAYDRSGRIDFSWQGLARAIRKE
ncbi:MAG: hypothetical protein ACM36C_08990, partial [Acidobacteriota bacterium]